MWREGEGMETTGTEGKEKKIQEIKDDRAVKGKKREDCVPERRSE